MNGLFHVYLVLFHDFHILTIKVQVLEREHIEKEYAPLALWVQPGKKIVKDSNGTCAVLYNFLFSVVPFFISFRKEKGVQTYDKRQKADNRKTEISDRSI